MGMDRSIAGISKAAGESEPGLREHGYAEKYIPPVLTPEKAAAIHNLKPFLKAVGDVNRLAILQELSLQDGLNVLDLAERLVLSQPLTSWHLHILKRARLVTTTNLGRQHIYRLNRPRLLEYKELFGSVIDL